MYDKSAAHVQQYQGVEILSLQVWYGTVKWDMAWRLGMETMVGKESLEH